MKIRTLGGSRAANRKLSRPRIVPGGPERCPAPLCPPFSKLTPGRRCGIMYTRAREESSGRRTRGDSSRYSLLMGVLFSGALGPPGTCHASLASPGTMLDVRNAAGCQRAGKSQGTFSRRYMRVHTRIYRFSAATWVHG